MKPLAIPPSPSPIKIRKVTKGRVVLQTIWQKIVYSRDQNLSTRLFSDATPHLWFFKLSKSGKNIGDADVLGWAVQCLQISKNQRSPPPKLTTIENNCSQFRRQSHAREKEWISIIHKDVFIACSSKLQHGQARFSLSLIRSSSAKKWAVFLPSGPEQHTPNLACCERRTKKTWQLLLPSSAA